MLLTTPQTFAKSLKEEDILQYQTLRFGTETAACKVLAKFNIDQSLLKYLVDKYGAVSSPDDLKDVRQESRAGLWAFVHSGRFRGECSLPTLFWRIAERKYVDWLRKQKPFEPIPIEYSQELAEDLELDLMTRQRADALHLAFEAWSRVCKGNCPEVLRAWSEKGEKEESYKEIEARFALNEGQGRKRVYECKEQFRNWLRKNPNYFEPLK